MRQGDLISLGEVAGIPCPAPQAALRACPFEGKHRPGRLSLPVKLFWLCWEWLAGPEVRLAVKVIPYVSIMAFMPSLSSGRQKRC